MNVSWTLSAVDRIMLSQPHFDKVLKIDLVADYLKKHFSMNQNLNHNEMPNN